MKCKSCEYVLWNLTARVCPECGQPFKPSGYEFIPNSVQFCCPHCKQPYFGTGEDGHLRPVEFDCVRCGKHIHMDDMVLRPAEGLADRDTQHDRVPWLERREVGLLRAWLKTVWMGMTAPQSMMDAMPRERTVGQAWLFMVLTVAVGTLGMWLLPISIVGVAAALSGPRGSGMFLFLLFMLVFWLISLASMLAYVGIWGLVAHGLLHVTGATMHPISRTYSALCFASGPMILAIVPCFGNYISALWWLVAAVLMVAAAQRTSGWRATFAVVMFPIVGWIGLIVGYALLLGMMLPAMAGMPGQFGSLTQMITSAQSVGAAIQQHASANAGKGPAHIAEVIDQQQIMSQTFILPGTLTQQHAVSIGSLTLQQWTSADTVERAAAAQQAIDALPNEVIAHRLGDFVFTYHGMDLMQAAPDLWVLITCADPDQNPAAAINNMFMVLTADGTFLPLPSGGFDADLQAQNTRRRSAGLPPLPHPWQVTHARPAVAGDSDEADASDAADSDAEP